MGRDTDNDWAKIAERDPYWGVLSEDQYRKGALTKEGLAQFMASGERFVTDLLGLVRAQMNPDFRPARTLDFGCGVGRLLIPLARHSREAVGVDIAPTMLELCKRNVLDAGLGNVALLLADDELSGVEGTFDFVNAYIVIQHIPPERGMRILRTLIERLRIGGIASLQVTYGKSRRMLKHEEPVAEFYRREGRTIVDLLDTGWTPPEGTIQMYDYDLNHVFALITRHAGHPIITLPTEDDGHLGLHCIFSRGR